MHVLHAFVTRLRDLMEQRYGLFTDDATRLVLQPRTGRADGPVELVRDTGPGGYEFVKVYGNLDVALKEIDFPKPIEHEVRRRWLAAAFQPQREAVVVVRHGGNLAVELAAHVEA